MNIDKLRQDLEIDEGIKHEVYLDHLNLDRDWETTEG